MKQMKQIQIIKPHQYKIASFIQLSDDRVVSGSHDCYIRVFSMNESNDALMEQFSLYKLLSKINCLIELRDSRLCSVDCGVNVTMWDLAKQVVLFTFKAHSREVLTVIDLKKERIATGSVDTLVKIWEVKERITLIQTIEMSLSPVNSLIQLKDKRLVSASTDLIVWG